MSWWGISCLMEERKIDSIYLKISKTIFSGEVSLLLFDPKPGKIFSDLHNSRLPVIIPLIPAPEKVLWSRVIMIHGRIWICMYEFIRDDREEVIHWYSVKFRLYEHERILWIYVRILCGDLKLIMLRVKLYKDDGEFMAYWKPYYGI